MRGFGQVRVDDADRHRATLNAVSIGNICKPRDIRPRPERRRGNDASRAIQVLGVDEKAVDSASLQRIAELKAFRLVREGSDLQAIEGAEIAHA